AQVFTATTTLLTGLPKTALVLISGCMTGAREEKSTHAPLSTSCRRQSSEPSTASLLTSIMSMPKTGANGSPGKPEPQSPLRTPKEILLGRVSYMRNQTRIAASTTPARYVTASLS